MAGKRSHDRLRAALPALVAAALVFALLLSLTSGLTFFADEWNVILRPDWSPDSLFAPLNEHIYVGPVVVFKLLLAIFGLDSAAPFRVANIAFLLAVAGFTWVLAARRLGGLTAALLACILLLLGPAWEDLLWPAGISFMGAMAAGLAAFAVIERETPRSDRIACALLVLSVAFSTLGLAFVAGALADVLLRGRRLARAYVPAVPIVLYLAWYLAYGRDVHSPASLENLQHAPAYAWNAASAALASLTGLSGIDPGSLGSSSRNGTPLLIAALLAAGWLVARDRSRLSRRFWAFAATALFFWISAAINEIPGREPGASRYQLIGAVLMILLGSELLRGSRLNRGGLAIAMVLTAAIAVSNLGALHDGERFLRERSDRDSAALAALDGARAQIAGDTALDQAPASPFSSPASAKEYFGAVTRWGEPIADPAAALAGPAPARAAADRFLAGALGIEMQGLGSAAPRPAGPCAHVEPSPLGSRWLALPPGGVVMHSAGPLASVVLRRWSGPGTPGVELGTAGPGATQLAIPADSSPRPWRIRFGNSGAVGLCPLAPPRP